MCGCSSALRRLFADFRFLCGGGRWGRRVEVGTHAHEEGLLTKYLLSLISYLRNLVGRLADMHKRFSAGGSVPLKTFCVLCHESANAKLAVDVHGVEHRPILREHSHIQSFKRAFMYLTG
jgi:hypothetical protein